MVADDWGTPAGKAGGFLALDWQDGGATGPLGRLSFQLHQELADTLGKDIGYRRVQTLSAAAAPAKKGEPSVMLCPCCSCTRRFLTLWAWTSATVMSRHFLLLPLLTKANSLSALPTYDKAGCAVYMTVSDGLLGTKAKGQPRDIWQTLPM